MLQNGNGEPSPDIMLRYFNRLTLTQQWIGATLLALLPLVSAVFYAGWSLAQQAQSQRAMVATIEQLSSLNASIGTQVTDIERSARQYLLLRNPRFLELYRQNVRNLEQQQRKLSDQWPEEMVSAQLLAVARGLEPLVTSEPLEPDVQEAVLSELHLAQGLVRQLTAAIEVQIQAILDREERRFDRVIQHLLIIGTLAIPGTILLVVLSSVAVARPMWRLAHAIQALGHEHWHQPISIDGPADLESLGVSLEWMRQRLLNSEKQKRGFLRHVTHELKTPLAAIMEAGSLLRDQVPGPMTEAQQQVVAISMRNSDHLQELIQQLLNYNAVAHGMLNADAQVDIGALCHKTKDRLRDTRAKDPCEWSIEGTPERIRTDPQAMEMILSNLLSNAHDFSAKSGKVAVRWGQDPDAWWLTIRDNGPGLSEQEQQDIFKPFFQGKARRQGPLKGTGLGLAIVQECVLHLEGTIQVVSDQGGSEFQLRFPLEREKQA